MKFQCSTKFCNFIVNYQKFQQESEQIIPEPLDEAQDESLA